MNRRIFPARAPIGLGAVMAAVMTTVMAAALAGCGSRPSAPEFTERPSGPPPLLSSSRTGAEAAVLIERAMDASDLLKVGHVLDLVSSSAPVSWRNPATGNAFTLTPMRGHAGNQGPCREFSVDATVAGTTDRLHGTACQGGDNRWRLQH